MEGIGKAERVAKGKWAGGEGGRGGDYYYLYIFCGERACNYYYYFGLIIINQVDLLVLFPGNNNNDSGSLVLFWQNNTYELISKYSYAYVHEKMIMTRIWWYYFRGMISVLVSCDCNELEGGWGGKRLYLFIFLGGEGGRRTLLCCVDATTANYDYYCDD